ncbi:hypothetical protein B0H16DRAFT_1742493 [Mycena metata]|uniref:Restriction of telomere capping protein 4 C-terminal domain-containing protein n=1 Tax=Mycena metata TaxID=1033252 RepID=A0AAD7MFD5_9AGAR|nr:hypothetical protein B0H16DRAFT_1742493 [Mycena metata]
MYGASSSFASSSFYCPDCPAIDVSVDQIFHMLASLVDTLHFVNFILTPHITISLIALELDMSFDEAWTVFQQSDKVGRALHPIPHTAAPQQNSPSPIKCKELEGNISLQTVWTDVYHPRRFSFSVEEAEKVQTSSSGEEVEQSPVKKQKKATQKKPSQNETVVDSPNQLACNVSRPVPRPRVSFLQDPTDGETVSTRLEPFLGPPYVLITVPRLNTTFWRFSPRRTRTRISKRSGDFQMS